MVQAAPWQSQSAGKLNVGIKLRFPPGREPPIEVNCQVFTGAEWFFMVDLVGGTRADEDRTEVGLFGR